MRDVTDRSVFVWRGPGSAALLAAAERRQHGEGVVPGHPGCLQHVDRSRAQLGEHEAENAPSPISSAWAGTHRKMTSHAVRRSTRFSGSFPRSSLKHGFESRWGHHFDFVEVFRERFPSRPGREGNSYCGPPPFFSSNRFTTFCSAPLSTSVGRATRLVVEIAGGCVHLLSHGPPSTRILCRAASVCQGNGRSVARRGIIARSLCFLRFVIPLCRRDEEEAGCRATRRAVHH